MNIGRKGFTLIEILIVVAIIAILASVVLVGLGPTQQAGRDARRLSDLQEIQNGLGLFYNDCGFYPGGTASAGACANTTPTSWATFGSALQTVVPGVGTVPQDPSSNRSYGYMWDATAAHYAVAAVLENPNNSVFTNYTPPLPPGVSAGGSWPNIVTGNASVNPTADCKGTTPNLVYCASI